MGLIPETVIEEVLARADILNTVRNYVSLKKSGQNYKGLCPFHDENTPSFNVHPGKGIYKCFGCGEGGNVIGFLMEIEGWSFPETVRHLAERNGVEIPEEDPEAAQKRQKRREGKKLYLKIMELAREFYEQNLWGEQGAAARHYLDERGIDEETARTFGLGYAPKGWQNLLDHLAGHDIRGKLVERAGLALARKSSSGHYDRFRHRIVFPVVDIWGNTLAFGGRTIAADDDAPKYINSPETRFYTKGRQLYGLHAAKQGIQKHEFALMVEGNFDVISLYAQGFDMSVAPMGTALTEDQARLVSRYANRVVIAFDGDEAGEEATLRCMPVLEEAGVEAEVVRFDELEDPDSFVRRQGADALWQKVEQAPSLVGWAIDQVLDLKSNTSVEQRVNALERVAEILDKIQDDYKWKTYAKDVARKLEFLDQELVNKYFRKPKSARSQARRKLIEAQRPLELEAAEYGLLIVLLDHPEWVSDFIGEELDNLLASQELADFLHLAADYYKEHGKLDVPVLLEKIDHRAFRKTVSNAAFEDKAYDPEKSVRYYQDCVERLKENWADRTLRELIRERERLDENQDWERWRQLYEQQKEIERFKYQLKSGRNT